MDKQTINQKIVPLVIDEINIIKESINGCYYGNKIRYRNEYMLAESFINIIKQIEADDVDIGKLNSKIDSLTNQYLIAYYRDDLDFARRYMEINIYSLNNNGIKPFEMSKLLTLYKVRNGMFILHQNVCTSELDGHQKIHYLSPLTDSLSRNLN